MIPQAVWGVPETKCPKCGGKLEDLRGVAFNPEHVRKMEFGGGVCFAFSDNNFECMALVFEEKAKVRGQALAESANWRNVQIAREIARELYLHHGAPISTDDVRVEMSRRFPDQTYGNWMGTVLRSPEWESVALIKSRTKGRHSNRIFTWRLK